jgi:penicillin-binding protein 1A
MAPAELWHGFMAAALPKLKVQPIPGGRSAPPPQSDDLISDILSNTSGMSQGADTSGLDGSTPSGAQSQGQAPPQPDGPQQ